MKDDSIVDEEIKKLRETSIVETQDWVLLLWAVKISEVVLGRYY
jgi:hypothetical protein